MATIRTASNSGAQYGEYPYSRGPQTDGTGLSSDVTTLKVEVDKLSTALSDVMGAVNVLVEERRAPPSAAPPPPPPQLLGYSAPQPEAQRYSLYQYVSATQVSHSPDKAQKEASDAIFSAVRTLRAKHPPSAPQGPQQAAAPSAALRRQPYAPHAHGHAPPQTEQHLSRTFVSPPPPSHPYPAPASHTRAPVNPASPGTIRWTHHSTTRH